MRRVSLGVTNLFVNLLWRMRPCLKNESDITPTPDPASKSDELESLRALIRRFPYWMKGRALLAEHSLATNDVATAYAEAQALLALATGHSHYHATALFQLGCCFLRRGDPSSALVFLDQAHAIQPRDTRIQEERSAAHVLLGDRAHALQILKIIPASALSAEGKAALQWLSQREAPTSTR